MKCRKEQFGNLPDGRIVYRFFLENETGMTVAVLSYGAVIQSVMVPDRSGKLSDAVLGYDTLEEYLSDDCCFGAAVGRVANRIRGAAFELNGERFSLTANEGNNTLHGGSGFHKKLWDFQTEENALLLRYESADLEDGFPGNLKTEIRFSLTDDNVLRLEYSAVCDKTTLCSLTGHSYFNLCGAGGQKAVGEDGTVAAAVMPMVSGHMLQIAALEYTPADADGIPTGAICPVDGTPYEFIRARRVGEEPLDGNLVLTHKNKKWDVRVFEPVSGRTLSVRTSLPGLQLYNGNGITQRKGKQGIVYGPGCGLALEPQFFPDAVHHPEFPQPVLKAGEEYRHFIEYRFGVV